MNNIRIQKINAIGILICVCILILFCNRNVLAQTPSVDISISAINVMPTTVNSGSTATFDITVNGPPSATQVIVTTMLPAQMAFVSGTPNCTNNRGTVACSIGALNSGTASVSINATATNPGTSPITVKTVAGVVGDQHDANMSNNSAVLQITINPVQAPPNPPSNLTATVVSNCRIDLQWTDNSTNEAGFEICVRGTPTSPCFWFAQVPANTTTYSHTGLLPNTTYRYTVRALWSGAPSNSSNEATATTSASLPAPTLVAPAQGATNVAVAPNLSWNAVTNATSYEVQLATDSGFANIVRCGSGLSPTNWTVTPALKTGTQYHWRARAANSCSKGAWSTPRNFTTAVAALRSNDLLVNASGNGVFEPGETVIVSPTWQNTTGSPIANVTGNMASFTGPGAAGNYTRPDASAGYGTIAANSTANCQTATGNCYSLALANPARPVQHWDASATENLSNGNTNSWTIHIGSSFGDVLPASPYYRFVETIFHNGITAGCGNNNFCPSTIVTRDSIASMLLLSKDGKCYAPPSCVPGTEMFLDVPASNPFCSWIEEIARRGVTSGCGSNNYCPTAAITRDQISIFLLKTKEGSSYVPPACIAGSEMFADVPASNPFCRYIEEIARRGATSGCGGGNYCPTAVVTRDQLSVFLTKIFNLTLYKP